MLMMARDRDYGELLSVLRGKRVLLWTCNTCSRLCNGIGGTDSAESLAEALRKDGVDVVGIMYTSASCLERKVRQKEDAELLARTDIIVSLTCDMGSHCACEVFGKETINPIVTLGTGYIGEDGTLFVNLDGTLEEVSSVSKKRGLRSDPFV